MNERYDTIEQLSKFEEPYKDWDDGFGESSNIKI